jgi:hypothetical protein
MPRTHPFAALAAEQCPDVQHHTKVMELLSGKTPVQAATTRFTESLSTLPGRQGPVGGERERR